MCSECVRTSFAQTLSAVIVTSLHTRHLTKASRTCCIWCYKQIQIDNLRSTWEASLSTSLGPSPILIIVKPLFPVLFPGIHENDRNLTCCTSSDTGAAVKQHLFQASVCPRVPEELLPHKAVRVSSSPRKTRNCFTAILPLGNIYSMCYSIPTSSLPMQSEMWKC